MNYIDIIFFLNKIIQIVFGELTSLGELFLRCQIFAVNLISEHGANIIKLFIMTYIDIIY